MSKRKEDNYDRKYFKKIKREEIKKVSKYVDILLKIILIGANE